MNENLEKLKKVLSDIDRGAYPTTTKNLNGMFKVGTKAGYEKVVKSFDEIFFQDEETQKYALEYCKKILEEKILDNNQSISSYEALAVHYLTTRLSAIEHGLSDIKINYTYSDKDQAGTGAFYSNNNKSINFFFNNTCEYVDFFARRPGNDGGNSRVREFLYQVKVINHELTHADQFSNPERTISKSIDEITPTHYIMMKETVARLLTNTNESKYLKRKKAVEEKDWWSESRREGVDRLYHDNHDQFLFEIDANVGGYEHGRKVMERISPKLKNIFESSFSSYYVKDKAEVKNFKDITWEHDTNPNDDKVSAQHKASLVIDTDLASAKQRALIMKQYPALAITYNPNGTKKSLKQVEEDQARKIEEINKSDDIQQVKISRIEKVNTIYQTAIESDPVLSLEKCLEHMGKISHENGEHYHHNSPEKELRETLKKAKLLIPCIEKADSKIVLDFLKKYKKEILSSNKRGQKNISLFEAKKLAYYELSSLMRKNRDIKQGEQEEIHLEQEKRQELAKAKDILAKVFPGFTPTPYTYEFRNDGNLHRVNNEQEKRLMQISTSKTSSSSILSKFGFSRDDVYSAINTVYDFRYKDSEVIDEQVQEKLDNEEISIIPNAFEPKGKAKDEDSNKTNSQNKIIEA